MKMKIYNFLVNRHSGIRQRYHRLHDNADRKGRLKSYAALLGMNMQYYLLRRTDFKLPADTEIYEEKNLNNLSETTSFLNNYDYLAKVTDELSEYDVISFDVFDTLIIRPFSDPKDVFFFIGEKLGIPDFKRIRAEQEFRARQENLKIKGHNEVSLKDIWIRIEKEMGVSAKKGMLLEADTERSFCFANPFMKGIYSELIKRGKTIIAISDMYLSSDFVAEILSLNGFYDIQKIFISCEYGKSKSRGDLYREVKKIYANKKIVHIGDNRISDVEMAQKNGFTSLYFPNKNQIGKDNRAYDMSPVVGGAYRGVVNTRIYSGLKKYSPEYEYGYVYGGLLIFGYCNFIHRYYKEHDVNKVLFLSRDGDILNQVYEKLFPEDNTEYVFISRAVAVKLMRNANRYDFFRRFLYYKVNRKSKIADILRNMGLSKLVNKLDMVNSKAKIKGSDYLTNNNVEKLKEFLIKHFNEIDKEYKELDTAAAFYYSDFFSDCKKTAVIDIGWAGSAALSLSYLAKNVWKLNCEITGLVAGTNTLHNSEPEASEIFLQSGRLVPYAFSQSLNRDIMKKHDPNKNYNVYWELLFSSPTRQFAGFELVKDDGTGTKQEKSQNTGVSERIRKSKESSCEKIVEINGHKIRLLFGEKDYNTKGIKRIQKGILDFVHDYYSHFKDYPYMFNISGRDAAAPMLLASSHDEKYLKAIAKRFDFKIDV